MKEKYLSATELREVNPAYAQAPQWVKDCHCASCKSRGVYYRAVADAASDKAYSAGEKERDALRAEVEVLRRAVKLLAKRVSCDNCPHHNDCAHEGTDTLRGCDMNLTLCALRIAAWAISAARKGE